MTNKVIDHAEFIGHGYTASGKRVKRRYVTRLTRHEGDRSVWWTIEYTSVIAPHPMVKRSFSTLKNARREYDAGVAEWEWRYARQ